MSINFKAPEKVILKPVITVIGVGGAGGNAVQNMMSANLQGATFVVANTDAQAMEHSLCENRIQLGATLTRGLGAGATPDVGRAAAEESAEEIRSYLEGSNMLFITAGMGGGTGTGASPVIAKIAKDMGILTVGVVTKPFDFEGGQRRKTAEQGLKELQKVVDTLIVITNQNLFSVANEHTTFQDAFGLADKVLDDGVRSVTDLMIMPGLINLDFADISAVMKEMGKAMMGTGEASGEDRAIKAAEAAISNPLLEHGSIRGAKGVLINITGGSDMTLFEVDNAATRVSKEVGNPDANIIFGSAFNKELEGTIKVSVVATGIGTDNQYEVAPIGENSTGFPAITSAQEAPDSETIAFLEENSLEEFSEETPQEVVVLEEVPSFEQYTTAEQAQDTPVTPSYGTAGRQISPALHHVPVQQSAKPSLFAKMWNSLKSGDKQTAMSQSAQPYQQNSHQQQNNGENNVQEVPAFLRRSK